MTIKEFFDRQNWITAKTYVDKAPHEYIVKQRINGTEEQFLRAAEHIRKYGFKAKFWRKENTYYHVDGKFYWIMDEDWHDAVIINRCDEKDYDLVFMKKKEDVNVLQEQQCF